MAFLRLAAVALLLTSTALAGCSTTEGGDGSASVYVKDAPTDEFTEIHVVFTEVRVHAAGGDDDDEEDEAEDEPGDADLEDDAEGNETDDNGTEDDDGSEAGWKVVFQSSGTDVDLLNASGDQAAFLGEADLEAGKYTQIRVVVKEAYGVDANGTRTDFTVSSGTLKVVQPFTVEADKESRIVLDFDLDQALHQTGNGQWRMTPVVGTTAVDVVDDAESGEETAEEGEVVTVEDE